MDRFLFLEGLNSREKNYVGFLLNSKYVSLFHLALLILLRLWRYPPCQNRRKLQELINLFKLSFRTLCPFLFRCTLSGRKFNLLIIFHLTSSVWGGKGGGGGVNERVHLANREHFFRSTKKERITEGSKKK